jgi:hypothetical protein
MKKNLFVLSMLSVLIFTGCFAPPVYIKPLPKTSIGLTVAEQKAVLGRIILNVARDKRVEGRQILLDSNQCLSTVNRKFAYKHCFEIKKNQIVMQDRSNTCYQNGRRINCFGMPVLLLGDAKWHLAALDVITHEIERNYFFSLRYYKEEFKPKVIEAYKKSDEVKKTLDLECPQ